MIKKLILSVTCLIILTLYPAVSQAVTCESGYIAYNNVCYKKLSCKNSGTQKADKCVCKDGWTGTLCQTAKKCAYTATACATGYIVEESCMSGNTKYVKCKINPCTGYAWTKCPTGHLASASCMSGKTKKLKCGKCTSGYVRTEGRCYKKLDCKNGGTQKASKCVCKDGWEGTLCQTAKTCTGFTKTSCSTGYVVSESCMSGNKKYVKCKVNPCTGYAWTTCPTGHLPSASCMSGKTKKLKCGKCTSGYVRTEGRCYKELACKNGGTQKADKCVCKDGWTGTLCQTAKACNGYTRTSCPTGYAASASCMAGNTKKLKCENCASGYIKQSGKCYKDLACKNGGTQSANKCVCKEGWTGTNCTTKATCAYSTVSCSAGYDETGKTCKSGNTTYRECKAKTVPSGYSSTKCSSGYTQEATFLSGTTTYYKCTANKCEGYVKSCATGYVPTSDTCLSGATTMYKCTENPCTGYLVSCPKDYYAVAGDTCLSGSIIMYKCTTDITDFDNGLPIVKKELTEADNVEIGEDDDKDITTVNNENLKVITNTESTVTGVLSTQDEVANALADSGSKEVTVDIEQRGNGDVYGMRAELGEEVGDGLDLDNATSVGNATVTSTIKIKNKGSGNTYGMYTNADLQNTEADGAYLSNVWADNGSIGTGIIDITSYGTGNVYGILNDAEIDSEQKMDAVNAQADEQATGTGIITINKIGNGNVYGIKAKDWAVNASAHGTDNVEENAVADGVININAENSGNIYGLRSDDYAQNANTGGGKETSALIRIYDINNDISNYADQKIYGMLGKHLYNAWADENKKATGIINIIVENHFERTRGEGRYIAAYGMYSDITGNIINNTSIVSEADNNEDLVKSTIEMALINSDNSYVELTGIYSKNGSIQNSGDILLHNLGNGNATGISGENATIINSGKITVDRSDFVDTKATADKDDDVTYTLGEVDWQNNYGISGTNSQITNSGDITVIGNSAVGINSSGGGVINEGKITVSGGEVSGIIAYNDVTNSGIINVYGNGGAVAGIRADQGDIINEGTINIISSGVNKNIGVYGLEATSTWASLTNQGIINIENEGNNDVYGIGCDGCSGVTYLNNGEVSITNIGNGNIIGVTGEIGENGSVEINNKGDGNVTGVINSGADSPSEDYVGSVTITNKGNGSVSDGYVAESEIDNEGDGSVTANAHSSIIRNKGKANITSNGSYTEIYNQGDGNIETYAEEAVITNEGFGNISINGGNIVKISNLGNGTITGSPVRNLIIKNIGDGNVFGLYDNWYGQYTSTISVTNDGIGSAYGYWSGADYYSSNNNIAISLVNKSLGNAYGMYFTGIDGFDINSDIEMANTADGLAVGLYAKNSNITNAGNITIHNLGTGTAVGIYAEGTSEIVNRGNITIDRKSFTHEHTFSGGNIVYYANSENGGKAVGIYGSGETTITNAEGGVIKIKGADKAIGIYSEGGNVYNYGTIILENTECQGAVCDSVQNAIRLYGGKLFQDGKMVADASWDSAPNDPRGIIGTLNNINNRLLSLNNYKADRSVYGMLNESEQYVTNSMVETDGQEAEINILNRGDGDLYGAYGHYVTNVNVTDGSGSGNVIIDNEGNGNIYGLAGFKQQSQDGKEWGASNTAISGDGISAEALIDITNIGGGNIYGLFAEGADRGADITGKAENAYGESLAQIKIRNNNPMGSMWGNIYGIFADRAVNATSGSKGDGNNRRTNTAVSGNGEANGVIDIINNSRDNVYGIYGKDVKNAKAQFSDKAVANAIIEIDNTGMGNVYGMVGSASDKTAYNAWVEDYGTATGNIIITNKNAHVYGIQSEGSVLNVEARNNGEAMGRIEISNVGGGNIYGISANSVYNAQSGYHLDDDGGFNVLSANGVVSINSTGNGNVYGLKANVKANNVMADDGVANGTIRISYDGEGNAYGIWGSGRASGEEIASYNASINNAYNSCVGSDDCSKGTAWANGQIIMINKNSGNAYAMYSAATGNMILNTNRVNFGKGVSSIISMGNIGDGLAVAIYSKNGVIENTGDIKIQNIANGTAIGLYADGNTRVINTGNITIDHRKIIDDNATPNGDDDVLYSPAEDNEVSGRAIGIYGAADSSIYNSGTIVIDGAKEAYGIYSEGGDVENVGDVVIDGRVTENSIRLNGGRLLQNGVLIAGADWNDNGVSGLCAHGTWTNDECICNEGWSGKICNEANNCPRKYTTMDCMDGYHEDPDDICWSGDTPMHVCVADECPEQYTADRCPAGYHADMKDTCMSGGMELHACVPDECEGYEYQEKCPAGYQIVDSCLAGDITMVSCKELSVEDEVVVKTLTEDNLIVHVDADGNEDVAAVNNEDVYADETTTETLVGIDTPKYYMVNSGAIDGNTYVSVNLTQRGPGDVYGIRHLASEAPTPEDEGEPLNMVNANTAEGYSATGNIYIYDYSGENYPEASAGRNIYGMYSNAEYMDIYNVGSSDTATADSLAIGNISINNNSDKNVYGIYSAGMAVNSESDARSKSVGTIDINNYGNGNIYGIYGANKVYNAISYSKGISEAVINITNFGNGNVYGINGGDEAEELANAQDNGTNNNTSDALISIDNYGNGNVYGIASNSPSAQIYNSNSKHANSKALIRILNQGNNSAYGLYGNSVINHEFANNGYNIDARINILNINDGNAYALYGYLPKESKSSAVNNDGAVVEMANTGNGLAVGIYAKDGTVQSSGDIIIHNLADGTAVGIMADGATHVENTGTIIIDREVFVDDNGTEDKEDDVEYFANGKTGGKAVGIYGSADSDILNGGTIRIYGAEKAYGIYSEGGSVTNTGRILIDDTECEGDDCFSNKQAISLNGGQLFQDGLLIAGADWGNAVDNDEMLIGSTDTLNNNTIYLNNDVKREVYGMYNIGGSLYNSNIADSTGIINITNSGGDNVYGMYAGDEGWATNASGGEGTVRINNIGNGDAYGIVAGNIQNATRNNGNVTGKVIVVNNGSGNAYGLHGKRIYSETNEDYNQYSEIEMANRGDGLAVGMYGTEYVKNSGAITIHNLGNGTAIGMYGDEGAEIDNTGIITIDRSSYTDHVNIIPSRSDPTYSADTETGGKAIGIYGAADTEIDNDGIINISGTADAYGIWSEGGDVENDGVIIINGNENSANAIRLNAGTLFQNGILIAEPEWSDIGDDYEDPESEENWVYIANNSDIPPITETSADDVVGFEDVSKTVINAFAYPKDATGSIEVTQNGSGSVYGIRGLAGDSNDEEDQEVYNSVSYGANTATGTIRVTNTGDGTGAVYGMYGSSEDMFVGNATNDEIYAQEGMQSTGTIEIVSSGNKNVYGIYSSGEAINAEGDEFGTITGTITIENNNGSGDVYGLSSHDRAYNANATEASRATGNINISNNGSGDVYGMFSERSDIFNSAAGHDRGLGQTKDSSYTYGLVNVDNNGKGSTYGMKGVLENDWNKSIFNARAAFNGEATGRVRVVNLSDGNLYGIYGTVLRNADVGGTANPKYTPHATGVINVISAEGKAYGMYGRYIYNQSDANRSSTIEMTNTGNGLAVGMYAQNGYINNSGDIIIHNLGNGKAVGIIAEGSTGVYNSGNITIDRESYEDDLGKQTYSAPDNALYGGTAIGIYGGENTSITNSGTITINKASSAFGIWSAGGNVVNTGSISIDGSKCTGDACLSTTNAIVLNGGTLFQDGELRVSEIVAPGSGNNRSAPATTEEETQTPTRSRGLASLNLNDFGGTVVASGTSQFIAEGSISGDLAINNNVIENGFDTTYTIADMIQAGDVSGLNLISQSALFDASLENGTDAVMTMKSFNEVVNNQSLADFLKQNYDAENNETLFAMLKNHETVAALNETLNSIIGNEVFNRFNFEDMTMMRELNMDVNNTLFNNNEDNLITSGNIAPFYFDSENGADGKYALYNRRIGKKSFGLSLAFSNVNSRDRKDNNSREDESFQMSVPFGYKAHGFKFITAPRFGYAYGHYDRDGFENTVYKGTMEKRMFGLMNEVRYPIKLGGWKIAPAAEFNMLGYHLKGGENAQAYSLNIKSQNNYSVETGLGIYANREFKPSKNSVLNFNAGIAAYHEFADPYTVELGMRDMNGSFKLRDERRKDNRAVVRTGFDYSYGDITLEGSFATFVDGTTHTRAGMDFRYNF